MTRAGPTSYRADTICRAFAYAIARHDFGELSDLLHPNVDCRALTPRRSWEPADHHAAVEVLRTWWGYCQIDAVERVEATAVGDRRHVAYRFAGQRPDGPFVVEQQAYFTEREGQIDWIQILCSGFTAPRRNHLTSDLSPSASCGPERPCSTSARDPAWTACSPPTCVISNDVINLLPDKPAVFADAARGPRTRGRLALADIGTGDQLPDDVSSTRSVCGVHRRESPGAPTAQHRSKDVTSISIKAVKR